MAMDSHFVHFLGFSSSSMILLQPRDYLSSWFLYFAIIIATIGILFGGHALDVNLPVYKEWKPLMAPQAMVMTAWAISSCYAAYHLLVNWKVHIQSVSAK